MADVTMQYIKHIKGRLGSSHRQLTDIKTASTSRTERAQMLLITALALAVILVTVALLLNAAIFTENVATRDTTADGHEAIELRGEVVQGIGELIERENRQGLEESEIVDNVESGINATGNMTDRERAHEGTIATVSHNDTTSGQLLSWDDEPREFNAIENETLVDELNDTRAFRFDFESLVSLDDPNVSQIEDGAFGVRFITPGENVTQYIYEDEDDGAVVIANATEGSDPGPWCTVPRNGTTTVDLTGNEIRTDDELRDCYRGLWPSDDPDRIDFINGADTVGNFTLTVDDTAEPTDDPSVETSDAVYSSTVDISYRTTDLTFETTARIAPGEP